MRQRNGVKVCNEHIHQLPPPPSTAHPNWLPGLSTLIAHLKKHRKNLTRMEHEQEASISVMCYCSALIRLFRHLEIERKGFPSSGGQLRLWLSLLLGEILSF